MAHIEEVSSPSIAVGPMKVYRTGTGCDSASCLSVYAEERMETNLDVWRQPEVDRISAVEYRLSVLVNLEGGCGICTVSLRVKAGDRIVDSRSSSDM
jgi:hypothetical protein